MIIVIMFNDFYYLNMSEDIFRDFSWLHQTADIFKFFADHNNSVIHADNPTSIKNSIKIIDGANQEQKEDVTQHHRLLENYVSISKEGQVNHTHSVTLCYSPTCSLLSDNQIILHDSLTRSMLKFALI